MRWIYRLFWVFVVLTAGLSWATLSTVPMVIGLVFWLLMGSSVLCPRCLRHVLETGRGSAPWIELPKSCVGCGRGKDDIWPFQWLFRRERN